CYYSVVMDIRERFLGTISDFGLLKKGDSVLVGLSGGPDSVALLYLLSEIRDEYRLKLAAAHLDHAIRANSSKDREFCRELCQKLKIKFHSRRIDVVKLAGKERSNVEETGRKARYNYFNSICAKYGYKKIATGHTMDDNAETVLFNLARGSGLKGLAGVSPKRGKIIRPLIGFRKSEIVNWLRVNKIKYRIDPTNRSIKYSRNRIRNRILPEMEKINPEIVKSISRFSINVSEDIELINRAVLLLYENALIRGGKSKIVLDLRKLTGYDKGLVKRVVSEAFYRLSGARKSPSFELLSRVNETIDGRSGNRSPLGKGIWIEKSQDRISIFKAESGSLEGVKITLMVPGITRIPGYNYEMRTKILRKIKSGSLKTKPSVALLDNSKVIDPEIRFRERGDRIKPLGMKGTRLLSDLLVDRKIPSFERGNIPLIVSRNRVAWVAGIIISEDFKVEKNTVEILRIEICRH
ncbi:MAG: tRNA lysidine(34) synthetase TilS, partial [Candidatus Zixiibacteriota bacterium]